MRRIRAVSDDFRTGMATLIGKGIEPKTSTGMTRVRGHEAHLAVCGLGKWLNWLD